MPYDSTPAAFKPYIPAEAQLPEMTLRALLMGVVLGLLLVAAMAMEPGVRIELTIVGFAIQRLTTWLTEQSGSGET